MLAQDDADLAEMAREELETLEPQMEEKAQEARILLLPKDPDDNRNAIIEVRAGAGGDEAGLFGAELVRMYQHYAGKARLESGNDRRGRNRNRRHQREP